MSKNSASCKTDDKSDNFGPKERILMVQIMSNGRFIISGDLESEKHFLHQLAEKGISITLEHASRCG